MSESIKRIGIYSIFTLILAPILVSSIIWLYKQAVHVPHIIDSIDRIEKTNNAGHEKIAGLIQKQTDLLVDTEIRLHAIELRSDHLREDMDDCIANHKDIDHN